MRMWTWPDSDKIIFDNYFIDSPLLSRNSPHHVNDELTTQHIPTMIETKIDELIAALNANTEALKAAGSAPAAAPATRAPRGSKSTPAPAEPTKEEAPTPATTTAPAAAAPAAKGPSVNDLKKFVHDQRTRLGDVSGEAVKKHKEESAKILKKYGLINFTSIPEDKVEAMLADFKNLNVEKQDDLEDDLDDNDGL